MDKAGLLDCWGVTGSFGQCAVSRAELGRAALKSSLPTCMSSVIKHIRNPQLFCKPVPRTQPKAWLLHSAVCLGVKLEGAGAVQAFPSFQGETSLWIQSRFAAVQASCCTGLWFM